MGRRRRRLRNLSKRLRRLLPGLQCTRRCVPDSVGRMQTSVPSSLHLEMDRGPVERATKMSDVSSRLEHSTYDNLDVHVDKYWAQRYRIFLKFDEGIQLDNEGWYSVTPEKIASHIAKRFDGMKLIVDLFSGFGGNCIQFALQGNNNNNNNSGIKVIGIEHNLSRIQMAMQNAHIYQVDNRIEFLHGDVYNDFLNVYETRNFKDIEIDAIFMSPPWGGPEYLNQDVYDIRVFKELIDKARQITENVAILVPRNVDFNDVFECFGACEVENNLLGGKLKTRTIYFGQQLMQTNDNEQSHTISIYG